MDPRRRHRLALLALGGAMAACAAGPDVGNPPAGPTVVAIAGVDLSTAAPTPGTLRTGLPDEQLWALPDPGSSDPHLRTPPTGPLSPAFQALRIDFAEPMDGSTLADAPLFEQPASGSLPEVLQSFCAPPQSGQKVQLVDAAGNGVIASVCYEPGADYGQHPHVYLVPGAGQLAHPGAAPSPFACHGFSSDKSSGDFFTGSAGYSLVFSPSIRTQRGTPLQLPTGNDPLAGWSWGSDHFSFRTRPFSLLAAGWQSTALGYFYWLQKADAAFMPLRDPVDNARTVPCTLAQASTLPCRLPADSTPFLLVLSRALASANGTLFPSLTPDHVRLMRANGTPVIYSLGVGTQVVVDPLLGVANQTPNNVITVSPGTSWEPGETYQLTLAPQGLVADDGSTLPASAPVVITFTASPAAITAPVVSPTPGSSNVPFDGASVQLTYQVPITGDTAITPHGTFELHDAAGGKVPGSVVFLPGSNDQQVLILPDAVLEPESVYTVVARGATIARDAANGLTGVPDLGGATFTTLPFGLHQLQDASAAAVSGSSTVDPAVLFNGGLHAVFTAAASGVSPGTITVAETGQPSFPHTRVTRQADATDWVVQVAPGDALLKYGQVYRVHVDRSIVDADSPNHSLKAYPCSVSDCSQDEFFTTAPFAPQLSLAIDPSQVAPGAGGLVSKGMRFELSFPHDFDPATVDLAHAFWLLPRPRGADGTAGRPDTAHLLVPACSVVTPQTIRCEVRDGTPLQADAVYTYGATFGGTPPGQTAATPTVSPALQLTLGTPPVTVRVDPNSAPYAGTVSATLTTPCQ